MVNDDSILRPKRSWRNPEESALKSINRISMYFPDTLPPTAREKKLFRNALAVVCGILICAVILITGCVKAKAAGYARDLFVKTLRR